MRLTLSIDSLIKDIYAHSAVGYAATDMPAVGEHLRAALRRLVLHAASMTALEAGDRLTAFIYPADDSDDTLTIEVDDSCSASPTALRVHLANAITFAALRLWAISSGDNRRADGYRACLTAENEIFRSLLDSPPPSLSRLARSRRSSY